MARYALFTFGMLILSVAVSAQDKVVPAPPKPGLDATATAPAAVVKMDPAARAATIEESWAYAAQELNYRFAYVDMWVNPGKYSANQKDEAELRTAKIMEGELMVLVRRMLLVPPHLAANVRYVLENTTDGMRVSLQTIKGEQTAGWIDFTKEGRFKDKGWSDEAKKYLGAETGKRKYTTNKDAWHAEMLTLLQNESKEDDGKIQDEGQIEYVAKELFALDNKFVELYTTRTGYGQRGLRLDFSIKETKVAVGTVVIQTGQNGSPIVQSQAAANNRRQQQTNPAKSQPTQPTPPQGRVIRK